MIGATTSCEQPITKTAPPKTWTTEQALALFELPFPELLYQAQTVHRIFFSRATMQLSTLLNIKLGGCPEDCHYCPQAARYDTGVKAEKLMSVDAVRAQAEAAKAAGATRFCMGAAWRELKDRDIPAIASIVKEIKALGMESCLTLGMLTETQAAALRDAGLDYYNHNIDTSREFYDKIINTRTFDDRLQTLQHVRDAGMKVCCGGIVGMGEAVHDRANMLVVLANMTPAIESVPINHLVSVEGTPLADMPAIDPFDFVRTIAVARIMMPQARVRLSAGRVKMSDELQALCFTAGANSIFYGREVLLTTANPEIERDQALLRRLGIEMESGDER